ncbi:MAG: flagellar hook protein FlgE [Hyphomicrobiaceae bacterium]|uniref:flagellar hook protein FlgE n=1 Tax=Pseudorhodoplanes sp. TaxID=1934341 RepID=UPI003D0D74E3
MSIGGLMRTSVSGMAAQSNRLSAVSENIANASTVGYKSSKAEFSSLLLDTPNSSYSSGGVDTTIRREISRQGVLQGSSSYSDIAIRGDGFFLVQDSGGTVSLTRAGAFVLDDAGQLVNSGGFTLLGVPLNGGNSAILPANGVAGLQPVDLSSSKLESTPTTTGLLSVNLPSEAAVIAPADMPSANAATAQSSARTSIVVYGNLGEEVTLDVYYARTPTAGEWEVSVYNAADRSAGGGFPYSSPAPLASGTLEFDATGNLTSTSPTSLAIPVPGGAAMTLSMSDTTQLATQFTIMPVQTNGNPPMEPSGVEISADGIVSQIYSNGSRRAVFQIPVATVASPDKLTPKSGNVFQLSSGSGDITLGAAGGGGRGSLISGALESSTVDMASELTDMVEAQRNYTANSRVFQTGSELMDVLVNLKR